MLIRCRGAETRINLVKNFQLKPIGHVKLLEGQLKKSCTGDLLTDSYYCFTYKDRNNNSGSFYCGSHAASHFLKLIGRSSIPLFNPLTSLNTGHSNGVKSNSTSISWNQVAKELHDSINLFIICWNSDMRDFVGDIKVDLEENCDQEPHISKIKTINSILKKDRKKRTLQKMITELRVSNPSLRPFSFDRLNRILSANDIPSNFG